MLRPEHAGQSSPLIREPVKLSGRIVLTKGSVMLRLQGVIPDAVLPTGAREDPAKVPAYSLSLLGTIWSRSMPLTVGRSQNLVKMVSSIL